MKTQTNSDQARPMYLLAVAALLTLIAGSVGAQTQTSKFKVGDHVEFSENSACLGEKYAVQEAGTIVEVVPGLGGRYMIEPDTPPGKSRRSPIGLPIYYEKCGMRATAAAQNQNDNANGAGDNRDKQPTNNGNNTAGAGGGAKFSVNDRIEFSENNACLGQQYSIPRKGTILEVNPGIERNYVILADPLPGQAPKQMTIPLARQECSMRLLGGAAPKFQVDKLRVDENDTVLADREVLDCENLKHAGRNGSPPPVELLKKLIRCLYEKPSPAGQDGATTMDMAEFTIGAPHRWRLYEDMGQGTANTLVYPVHVKWNMKTFYRTRNVEVTDKEGTFTCFADADNLWQCGSAAGPHKDGKTQEIMVKKE